MAYHEWGDTDVDWKAIGQAQNYIYTYCKKHARLHVHTKEKYGTIRYEWRTSWGVNTELFFHGLLYPGHLYIRYPRWLRTIDEKLTLLLTKLGITDYVINKQQQIFQQAVIKAMYKYPQVAEEIVDDLLWGYDDDEEKLFKRELNIIRARKAEIEHGKQD